MKLYYFPLSTYSQKTLIALYEKNVPFTPEIIAFSNPEARVAYRKVNPYGKVPTLVLDDGSRIPESSNIIEYVDDHFEGTRLVPADKERARLTRFYDRCYNLYLNDAMSAIFFDSRKPEAEKSPQAVAAAKATLDTTYALCDEHFASRTWTMGDEFTMADCASAPVLAYCRMVYPFTAWKHVTAYANRLAERPSFARVTAEAAPYLAEMMKR